MLLALTLLRASRAVAGGGSASLDRSGEKTQGRDLNGEDVQVAKIKSYVETGG